MHFFHVIFCVAFVNFSRLILTFALININILIHFWLDNINFQKLVHGVEN